MPVRAAAAAGMGGNLGQLGRPAVTVATVARVTVGIRTALSNLWKARLTGLLSVGCRLLVVLLGTRVRGAM
jgi:hypothetical protein